MASSSCLRRFPTRTFASLRPRAISTTTYRLSSNTNEWDGRHGDEHVLNRGDNLDVQSDASKSGKQQRSEDSHSDSATSGKDARNDNEQAKKDHPEAPGPVIGMNSGKSILSLLLTGNSWNQANQCVERGGVSASTAR